MPALANSARAVARSWTAHQMPAARAGVTAMQTRNASASSFDSPFKGSADSTKIPSFAAYRNKNGEQSTKVFQYFMVGSMGALSALGAKATVQGKPAYARRAAHTQHKSSKRGGIAKHGILGDIREQLAVLRMIWGGSPMESTLANAPRDRLPCQHVRLRRRFGSGQG